MVLQTAVVLQAAAPKLASVAKPAAVVVTKYSAGLVKEFQA